MSNLKNVDTHFAFGENWSQYAKNIDETKIMEAEKGLLKLVTREELAGKTFLDIGCGSGLHALAALRLGAQKVLATDIDADSVATTKAVLTAHAPVGAQYEVKEVSVFDLPKSVEGQFDIVYSWGVLHHTGDMHGAITEATKMVRPGGLFVVALYRQTLLCGVWKHIKRWYAHTNEVHQKRAQNFYISLYRLRCLLTGTDFEVIKRNYHNARGMSFEYDVHDWLGGYPYESITPEQLQKKMHLLKFSLVQSEVHRSGVGLFGSGCDEFVFKKSTLSKDASQSHMGTITRPKIAVVIDNINQGGGAEKNAIRLAEGLQQLNNNCLLVTFYTLPNEYAYSGRRISFTEEPALRISTKVSKFYRRLRAINKLVRSNEITHVVAFLEVANFSVLCTKLLFRTPCKIVMSVRADPRYVNWFRRQIIRFGYRYADTVVAVSQDMKRILEEDFGLTNVVAIPNPINVEYVRKQMQKPLPLNYHFLTELPKNAKVFINVGRLVDQKSQDLLIRAFAKVHTQNQNTYLLIIGEGPKRSELEQLIISLGLSEHAFMIGQQSNIYPFLRVANCFVLTSKYEGFPNVLLEAAAADLYIISTDCPTGPREIIAPEIIGKSVNYPLRVPGASLLPDIGSFLDKVEIENLLFDEMSMYVSLKLTVNGTIQLSRFIDNDLINDWIATLT